MKKLFLITILLLLPLCFSSCFFFGKSTTFPDMVEYSQEEVLLVAKEKYDISRYIFDDVYFKGETSGEGEEFTVLDYSSQFPSIFVNGDNIENAFRAFAGKNGGHDIQGQYHAFLCYVALAECQDGSLKFIYYNTNIHKDAEIIDTIGASDYTLDISPEEITNSLFIVANNWSSMIIYLRQFQNLSPEGFLYSRERLTTEKREAYRGVTTIEYYRENGEIVFDLYYDPNEYDNEDNRQLVYSTSERYGVIYNHYGFDLSTVLDIEQTVRQSEEDASCVTLEANIKIKDGPGNILFSRIVYSAEYNVLRDGKVIPHGTTNETVRNKAEFRCGWMIDKIEGVDHAESAKVCIPRLYILYEKESNT